MPQFQDNKIEIDFRQELNSFQHQFTKDFTTSNLNALYSNKEYLKSVEYVDCRVISNDEE